MERANNGVLFKNDRKEPGDNRPDYTGKWNDEQGQEWQLAAWIKDGRNGKFMSLKATPPYKKDEEYREAAPPVGGGAIDDEIPFVAEWRG